ncbi:hypothetical protein EJ03DRAFT_324629 [Teratosphaeria nubilosa]|uniref:Uncharacterized protein n=1 Tax=Teratosphaeria nubilosa TaxID=161662 RepID=A0A6G1LIE1_9PEZI|nr:hypothetical protein EJ03DRAFT_324629 [Teratosphaeria nubilosa]
MLLLVHILCGALALAGAESTSAVSVPYSSQGLDMWNTSNPVAMQQVMANLSSAFGNILTGSADSNDELDTTCSNINATSNGKWQAEGLLASEILSPICLDQHNAPNAEASRPYVVGNMTNVFVTEVINAFGLENQKLALTHLCNNLESSILNAFLDGVSAIQAICATAGQPYNANSSALHPTDSAFDSYIEAASMMFGRVFVSSATSDSQANLYCAHSGNHIDALDTLGLNATIVDWTICNNTWPLTVQQGIDAITNGTTIMFAIALTQSCISDGWSDWLCRNLDIAAMYGVGLNGTWIADQVC